LNNETEKELQSEQDQHTEVHCGGLALQKRWGLLGYQTGDAVIHAVEEIDGLGLPHHDRYRWRELQQLRRR
jgi:hypothetical protein